MLTESLVRQDAAAAAATVGPVDPIDTPSSPKADYPIYSSKQPTGEPGSGLTTPDDLESPWSSSAPSGGNSSNVTTPESALSEWLTKAPAGSAFGEHVDSELVASHLSRISTELAILFHNQNQFPTDVERRFIAKDFRSHNEMLGSTTMNWDEHRENLRRTHRENPRYSVDVVYATASVDSRYGKGVVWMTLAARGGPIEGFREVARETVFRLDWRRRKRNGDGWKCWRVQGIRGAGVMNAMTPILSDGQQPSSNSSGTWSSNRRHTIG